MRIYCTFALILIILGCSSEPLKFPYENARIEAGITTALPKGWHVVDRKLNEIPYGHNNKGSGGTLLILGGPQPVNHVWRDTLGNWHEEPIAKESIELWIIPASYRADSSTFFDFHRPIQPKVIFSSESVRIYASPSHHIISMSRYVEIGKQATATSWSDIETKKISWTSWKEDLNEALSKQ